MPETPTARCTKCGRPKSVGDKASLTQWIVCCNCVEGAPEAPTAEPVDLCAKCKKRISGGRAGSFTQWVFRSDLCNCEVPEAMRPSFDVVEQELPDWIEEEDELELEGEPPFPLDRYKPLMELGKGTSGHVYLCKDRLLEKKVAIKCLWAVTPEQLIGFQREAKATSLLSHPGVVSVLDFGGTAGGAPYMVMEYVQGTSLFDYISEHGPLPTELALRVFVGVAEALAHAHEKGVFHRDVKSANILLVGEDTDVPTVRVIDFGVAGVKQAINAPKSDQGDTLMVGTPAYMSPDQAQGRAYDQRSEIYSLGCVMYEALTGKPPFESDTALETISKHAHVPAPLLADSDCDRFFSPELESIVGRCLEKAPADRFQSMKKLISAIQDLDLGGRNERIVSDAPDVVHSGRGKNLFAIAGGAIIALGAIAIVALNVLEPDTFKPIRQLFSSRSEAESRILASKAWEELENYNAEKAIALSTQAISLDDENFRAFDTRGVAYFLMGDTKNALLDLNKVIKDAHNDVQNSSAARFHRDVVYIAIGKKIAQKSFIPSSNQTYVPTQWESKAFARWIKQDWRLLPLNAPAQVGAEPSTWPKDMESSPFAKMKLPGASADQQKEFDSKVKQAWSNESKPGDDAGDATELQDGPMSGSKHRSADAGFDSAVIEKEIADELVLRPRPGDGPGPGPRRGPGFRPGPGPGFRPGPGPGFRPGPGPGFRPGPGPGFRRQPGLSEDEGTSIAALQQNPNQKPEGSDLPPAATEEIDEFGSADNFFYSSPTKVKVSTLGSKKDIEKIIANPKIRSVALLRVPISPTVLAKIRVLPLEELDLEGYSATDKDLEFVKDFKNLDHFTWTHGVGTGSFVGYLPENTMVDLVLRAMKNFNQTGLERIKKLRHLKTLVINSMEQIGNSGIKVAVDLPLERLTFTPRFNKNPLYHNKEYELAVMPNSKFDYYDVGDLKKIIAKPTLKKLVLDCDGLKDASYDDLSRATVSELTLQGQVHIKLENLQKLSKNSKINAIFFCGDVIGEDTAAGLSGFQHLPSLLIFHSDLKKKMFDAMSKIRVGNLVIVNDKFNSVTVQYLAALKHVKKMKIVDQSNKLTSTDIDSLREKIPTCTITLKDQR